MHFFWRLQGNIFFLAFICFQRQPAFYGSWLFLLPSKCISLTSASAITSFSDSDFHTSLFPLLELAKSPASLYTSAELNLRDRLLGEVEKNSFIALPGKGGYRELLPSKTMCPNLGEFGEEFYSNSSRVGFLISLGCV